MSSSNTKTKIQVAVMIAATTVLAAGCSSCKTGQTSYNKTPAPIYPEAGAPPAPVETETVAATSTGNSMVIPLQKEQLNVGTTQVPAGSVKIHKYVKTETVTQPVQVRTETVSIERVPPGASPPAGSPTASSGDINKPFQSGEVVLNLTKEEPFVSTQVVPNGSVVVNKQQSTQTVNVQRQVRSEDVAAVPSGNTENLHISGNVSANAPANEAVGAPASGIVQSGGTGGGITQIEQISSASDPSSMTGQQVSLSGVSVQKVVGPHLIVIGPPGGTPVYVHIAQPAGELSSGQIVMISGTVQPAPTSSLDQQSAQALQGQQVFIEAKSVTPASQ